AGVGPPVALGGQVTNAGYGAFTRQFGHLVDYLEAVEVVVVDAGAAALVVVGAADSSPSESELDIDIAPRPANTMASAINTIASARNGGPPEVGLG
ncbi:hypothetical protein IU471_27435, partial [Nocardia elegans]|nr:hypothetical protein [Nocardia elegans]